LGGGRKWTKRKRGRYAGQAADIYAWHMQAYMQSIYGRDLPPLPFFSQVSPAFIIE
jgi:hypothetical protein